MGWSCRQEAGQTLDRWQAACRESTDSSNVWIEYDHRHHRDRRMFFEVSSTEHADGAITGTIWRFLDDVYATRAGSFRIDPDGTVRRAPAFLRRAAVA